jgi:hypothetical protein
LETSAKAYLDKTRIYSIGTPPPELEGITLLEQTKTALEGLVGEAFEDDAFIKDTTKAAEFSGIVMKEVIMNLKTEFQIGRHSVKLNAGVHRILRTSGTGFVEVLTFGESGWARSHQWVLKPLVIGGVCEELACLERIFGITSKLPAQLRSGLNTGKFSLLNLPGKTVLAVMKKYSRLTSDEGTSTLSRTRGIEAARWMGFTEGEANDLWDNREDKEFNVDLGEIDSFRKFSIPELTIAPDELVKNVYEIPNIIRNENSQVYKIIQIVSEVLAGMSMCDTLAGLFAYKRANSLKEGDLYKMLGTQEIVIGRSFSALVDGQFVIR